MNQAGHTLERVRQWLEEQPRRADLAAVLVFTALWALFFWRALTPNPANQVSYPDGDFSGQFLTFGAYQAARLLAGEVPLWNPYNYAGHPFLADTQAAVFYPLRLATIFLSQLTGGWSYAALQAEALAHVWLGGLAMFVFVRSATRSRVAGLVSAITLAFGGYLTGYPPLQLAVLEAGIWLPISLLGVLKASQPTPGNAPNRWQVRWLVVSALALGLSLLAGHPQTTLLLLYVLMAYIFHRAVRARIGWLPTLAAMAGVAVLGFGMAAVQVLPGLEYSRLTVRAGLGFDELAGGFPYGDLVSLVLPNVVSVWSPLYSGIAALALAGVAIGRKRDGAWFWLAVALAALVLSFGGGTLLYHLAYLTAPGYSWFRGQERTAYVVAHAVAIMAGLGTAALLEKPAETRKLARALGIGATLAWVVAVQAFVISHLTSEGEPSALVNQAFYLAVVGTGAWVIVGRLGSRAGHVWWPAALILLVVFDLFSANMNTNWEPIPPGERTLYERDMAAVTLEDDGLYRVDGRLGLSHGNYATLIGLQDVRGISPLRLETLEQYQTRLPDYRLHEILNVKYVFTDWVELERPSTIIYRDEGRQPPAYLHALDDPLPRAWMAYWVMVAPDEAQALGWLADPSFDPRTTVILDREPELSLPAELPTGVQVQVVDYAPERIVLSVMTPEDGVLVLSEMDYPGWRADVDGQRAPIWRANAGLRALPLEAGEHEIVFTYRPATFGVGVAVSMLSLAAVVAGALLGHTLRLAENGEGRP